MYDDRRSCLMAKYKLLYSLKDSPRSCMQYGLEVPDAWLDEIDSLSANLEKINSVIWKLFKVKVVAEQVKSKFGTLRFYYSVVAEPPMLAKALEWISRQFARLPLIGGKYCLIYVAGPTRNQRNLISMLYQCVNELVAASTGRCGHICEHCGAHIGDDDSPRCITRGWVSYLCKECADKAGFEYFMDNAVWKAGMKIKDLNGGERK